MPWRGWIVSDFLPKVLGFLDVCNENFESESIPTPIAAGLIYTIPKGETQSPDVTK